MKKWLVVLITIALLGVVYSVGRADTVFVPFVPNDEGHVHVSSIQPYPSAPECANHDPAKYHGLWDAELGCHFDHTHNINPLASEVQAVFGNYTAYTGQEVSYPWQTFAGAAPGLAQPPANAVYENNAKHNGTKFDFYDFGASQYGCPVNLTGTRSVPNAWLIERHSLGNKADFMARVHSFWAMVRVCIPGTNEVGYIFTGGWQDFGQRIAPYQGHIFPIPGQPSPAYNSARAPYISQSCINHPECRGANTSNTTWTSFTQMIEGHKLFGFAFRSNDSQQKIDVSTGFNQVDPVFVYLCADAQGNYVAAGCHYNHSASHTAQVVGSIPDEYDLLDGVDDDRANYIGYTNRWGSVVQGCTAIALDCVPLKLINMPVGNYQVNVAQYGLGPAHENLPEYDLEFSGVPAGWIGESN